MYRAPRLFVACAFLALGSRAESQSAGRPLTIEDYYRLKTIGAPELSSDGRWVAFTVVTRIEETNGIQSEVWLVPFDAASAARRVSADGANATAPSWTSDGRLRYTIGGRAMVVDPASPERVDSSASPGGVGARAGRGGGGDPLAPQPSPDGKWVASVRDTPPPEQPRVYESDFDKRHQERFKGVQFDWMEFHRDGAPFPLANVRDPLVSPPQEVFLARVGDDDNPRQLTHLGVRPAGLQWSRDGGTLLFSADSMYRDEHLYGRTDIFTVTTEGRE